jgi:hypothetical protein
MRSGGWSAARDRLLSGDWMERSGDGKLLMLLLRLGSAWRSAEVLLRRRQPPAARRLPSVPANQSEVTFSLNFPTPDPH